MMPTSFAALTYRGQVGRLRQLAQHALDEYDLGPGPARLTLLAHMDNTTFRVDKDDGARYLLRVHRASHSPSQPRRSIANVRSEMHWLAALRRDTDLVVPTPITSRSGASCVITDTAGVSEPRICALLGWIEGRFINRRLTAGHLEQVGIFTAWLHEHTAHWEAPVDFDRGRVGDVPDEVVRSVLDIIAAHYDGQDVALVERVIRMVQATNDELDAQPNTSGLIHADLHQDNYLFLGRQVRAIDFDDCGWGRYLYDLAVTLSEIRFRPDYPALRAALLHGYTSVRALPADHGRHLDAIIGWRMVQLIVWFLEQRDHPGFADWRANVRDGLDQLALLVASAADS